MRLISRQALPPLLLTAAVVACAIVAAAVGQAVWAAAAGSGLVLLYWALEALTWWRARDRDDLALGLAIGGMFARLLVVLAALVIIGVFDRPSFPTAVLSFLITFTLYILVRPFASLTASTPAGQARL